MDVCANGVQIAPSLMDREVLASLAKAFDARMIEEAIERGLGRLRQRREQSLDRRPTVERELALIEKQIGHPGTPSSAGAPPTSCWQCWRPRATGRRPSPGSWRGWTTSRGWRRWTPRG
ncbi:MAG: hypothetical protein DME07_05930 [Candidatus Rokuibacteriota bacterium]|nr:MAG: hypothetical protein DME07_05930 [Candidatus Rokubacteria bacterium]